MRDPDDVTRLVLAIIVWTGFIGLIFALSLHGVPKGNEGLMSHVLTSVLGHVSLVTSYYFKRSPRV
jgi:hypothetical protein